MRLGWMRYWRCGSAVVVLLLAASVAGGVVEQASARKKEGEKRTHELTLAGLRPGKDNLAEGQRRFAGAKGVTVKTGERVIHVWDECTGRMMDLDYGANEVLQSVAVSALGEKASPCNGAAEQGLLAKKETATGRGLRLEDARARVLQLYGAPESEAASTYAGRELQLLFYSFDWAGADVPQSMEVTVDPTSKKVVKITLAAASL